MNFLRFGTRFFERYEYVLKEIAKLTIYGKGWLAKHQSSAMFNTCFDKHYCKILFQKRCLKNFVANTVNQRTRKG